jgi:hypothetical protein
VALAVGEGTIPARVKDSETENFWIKIPDDILLMHQRDHLLSIVQTAYLDLEIAYGNIKYLKECAIVVPTNEVVDVVNSYMVSIIPGDLKEYFSCDTIAKGPDSQRYAISNRVSQFYQQQQFSFASTNS